MDNEKIKSLVLEIGANIENGKIDESAVQPIAELITQVCELVIYKTAADVLITTKHLDDEFKDILALLSGVMKHV